MLSGSGAGRAEKFRARQETNTSRRRGVTRRPRWNVGRWEGRGIIPLIPGNIMQHKAESILIFTTQSIP